MGFEETHRRLIIYQTTRNRQKGWILTRMVKNRSRIGIKWLPLRPWETSACWRRVAMTSSSLPPSDAQLKQLRYDRRREGARQTRSGEKVEMERGLKKGKRRCKKRQPLASFQRSTFSFHKFHFATVQFSWRWKRVAASRECSAYRVACTIPERLSKKKVAVGLVFCLLPEHL